MYIRLSVDSADIEVPIRALDNIREAAPVLAFNALEIIATQFQRNAKSYLGTKGPSFAAWRPIKEWAIRSRVRNKANLEPLLDTGRMRSGIRITSRRRGNNPNITVTATDWKSEIHEYGHPNNGRPIPPRPFMAAAAWQLASDTAFNSALERFIDEYLDIMAFDKTGKSARWFKMVNKDQDNEMAPISRKPKGAKRTRRKKK